jgi:hypothetical protein
VLTFIRVAFGAEDREPSLAGFLVQAAMDVAHLPGGECRAAALVEQFVHGAVGSAVRRGEVDEDPEALTDMLMGLVWGAAFQIGRGNAARADRMLEQLCGMLDQGLVR